MTIPRTIETEGYPFLGSRDVPAWEFSTARYTVALFVEDEEMAPADSFEFDDDIEAVRSGAVAWFQATVVVYGPDGTIWGRDDLGGCAYKTVREFYSSHRWQYSQRQDRWITDPKSRAWKACEARRPRQADGSRADGGYFADMVRTAVAEAKAHALRLQFVGEG